MDINNDIVNELDLLIEILNIDMLPWSHQRDFGLNFIL